jgi:hypothetical protein
VRLIRFASVVVMVFLSAHGASAQSSTPDYVRSRIAIGQVVWVTTEREGTLQGRVAAISDSQFEVSMLGRVSAYPWADIRLIEAPDSIKDGTVLGGIIGGLALANVPSSRTAGNVSAYALLGAGLGAAAGAYGDYLREGREIILRNNVLTSRIAPILLPGAIGVSAVIRW